MDTKQKILPFFPLGVFLFPGEDLPLRIFEPRYLQLIDEASEDGFTFAIPFYKNNEIMEYGCEVKLQQVVAKSQQGRKVITVESVALLRINSYTSQMAGKLYAGGNVEVLPPSPPIRSSELMNMVVHYTEHFDKNFLEPFNSNELRYYDIVRSLNLSSEDKYLFVQIDCDESREKFLSRQIQYLMLIRNQEKMLDDDFRLN
ncbi:MAG: LON peptidase substrate-binding domain-containing protein [Bacteroidales bacterium]|nr:LON peptidase substrate-binding domain-containing protein [Bacteroidales bacterium]MDT8430895.1 LON peptidase substrate-binding domain-containing protein [Bacteroidales bacterium]